MNHVVADRHRGLRVEKLLSCTREVYVSVVGKASGPLYDFRAVRYSNWHDVERLTSAHGG